MSPRRDPSTVIIFDWDDTICPSTFVDKCNINSYHDLPLHYQNLMDTIGDYAAKCLAAASKYGEVIIITNSDDGWVQFSAERYVPNLVPVVAKYRIVSARTSYENFYPGQPLCWKAAAFAHEVNEMFTADDQNIKLDISNNPEFQMEEDTLVSTDAESSDDSQEEDNAQRTPRRLFRSKKGRKGVKSASSPSRGITGAIQTRKEVISFGDSMEERTAVKIVSAQLSATPKSVMFVSSPSPDQLIGQLSMLTGHMKHICENEDSLDLEVSRDQAEKCADTILRKRGIYQNSSTSPTRIRPGGETFSI